MSYPIPVLLSAPPESVALQPAVSGEPDPAEPHPGPDALALAQPQKLRIGAQSYGYVYTQISMGTYKCSRGSDKARPGEVLWLRRVSGDWLASDADSETSEYVVRFSSKEDILSPGWHSWRMWDSDSRVGQFETTVL